MLGSYQVRTYCVFSSGGAQAPQHPVMAGKATAWKIPRRILATRARYTWALAATGNSKVRREASSMEIPNTLLKPILLASQAAGI